MISLSSALFVVGFSLPAFADPVTFSVGDLGQYKLQATPTADGDVVMYTGNADTGISVVFSASLKDKIKAAAKDNCKALSDDCLKSINDVLKQSGILDSRSIEPRQDASLPGVALLNNIITGLSFFDPNYDPYGHLIPAPKIDFHLATASQVAVITEDGKPAVTITQDAAQPTGTGPDAPSLKIYTSAADGHDKGDIVITLPDNLARRTDEIIGRLLGCSTDDITRRSEVLMRAPDLVHDAICGGRAIYTNADVQGALAQLDIIQMPNLNLRDPALMGALTHFIAWARARGADVRLPAPQVDSLAVLGFVLGLIRATGNTLQRVNTLRAQYLNADTPTAAMPSTTAAATTTCSGSGTCTVSCSLLGVIEYCETACPSCGPQPTVFTSVTTGDWAWPTSPPDVRAINECAGDMSDLPWPVFQGIPAKFCAEVDKDPTKPLEWVVNGLGDLAPALKTRETNNSSDGVSAPGSRLARSFWKRTPPPDPDKYKDYRITLKWEPRAEDKDFCVSNCSATYSQLENSDCNPSGAFNKAMTADSSMDNMCDVYSYHIQAPPKAPPKTPLTLTGQSCHDKPPHHGDVSWNDQGKWGNWLCDQPSSQVSMKAGDKPITWTPTQWDRDAFLTYTISWVDGCVTDVTEQSVQTPVDGATCKQLLREDFTACTSNEGVGGWRQAGCLKYEFLGHDGG